MEWKKLLLIIVVVGEVAGCGNDSSANSSPKGPNVAGQWQGDWSEYIPGSVPGFGSSKSFSAKPLTLSPDSTYTSTTNTKGSYKNAFGGTSRLNWNCTGEGTYSFDGTMFKGRGKTHCTGSNYDGSRANVTTNESYEFVLSEDEQLLIGKWGRYEMTLERL